MEIAVNSMYARATRKTFHSLQGRIHGLSIRVRVGSRSDDEDEPTIGANAAKTTR